jgi:hypothetical protein
MNIKNKEKKESFLAFLWIIDDLELSMNETPPPNQTS